jgi:hypothetical protein
MRFTVRSPRETVPEAAAGWVVGSADIGRNLLDDGQLAVSLET